MSSVTDPRTDGDVRDGLPAGHPGVDEADEAGTDEVAALAAMLATPTRPHGPADEDDETVELERADEREVLAVLPRQRDEFTCTRCFLVMHISRRVGDICCDCS